jgi:branched-subunit amino acid ABC-type transport system permease component
VLLGVLEGLITVVATPTWARIASLAVMGVILLARPDGIFRRRAVLR